MAGKKAVFSWLLTNGTMAIGFVNFPDMHCMKSVYKDEKNYSPLPISPEQKKAFLFLVINNR